MVEVDDKCRILWVGVWKGIVEQSGVGVVGPLCLHWCGVCVVEGDAMCVCNEVVAVEPVFHFDKRVRKASRSGGHSVSCASEGECDVEV